MELHEIRYFKALHQLRHFTRAAAQCNVSQPALTRAIQKLESELGGLLFSRERHAVHVTELGRKIEPHLEQALAAITNAKEAAAAFVNLKQAHLPVGLMTDIAPHLLTGFLCRFRSDHPGIDLHLRGEGRDGLVGLLQGAELDVALVSMPDAADHGLQYLPLQVERLVLVCAADHAFARRRDVEWELLEGEAYVSYVVADETYGARACWQAHGVNPAIVGRSDRHDSVLAMVAAGLGVAIVPEFGAAMPGVVARPFGRAALTRTIALATARGRRQSAPLAAFLRAASRFPWPGSA
jgi:LysR family transcriptional regulator, hydrogen peroxide-inducible genes activator